MQTAGQCKGMVGGLIGDPDFDWLTDAYFYPLANIAMGMILNKLALTCSPYIEKVVVVPAIPLGIEENNLGPNAQVAGQMPLQYLKKPRILQWKPTGDPPSRYKLVDEFSILPNPGTQIAPLTVDIQVRGDFLPAPLVKDSDIIQLHPNLASPLALLTASIIGCERPNDGWTTKYGALATDGLVDIAADLTRQQQHVTYRLGAPNRDSYGRGNFNLSGNLAWEWRSFGLYVQLM